MKKFNLKLHTSILLTILLLQGCMPDSMTKFKKDAPKKSSSSSSSSSPSSPSSSGSSSTPTTTNGSGQTISYKYPLVSTFSYATLNSTTPLTDKSLRVGKTENLHPLLIEPSTMLTASATAGDTTITVTSTAGFPSTGSIKIENEIIQYGSIDATHFKLLTRASSSTVAAAHVLNKTVKPAEPIYGFLSDSNLSKLIFVKCLLSQDSPELPKGMSLNTSSCNISGNPTTPYNLVTPPSIVPDNYEYTVELYYKDSTYTTPGTEKKLTSTIKLGSYFFDSAGNPDTNPVDYPLFGSFTYTELVSGVATAVTTKDLVVGSAVQFDPHVLGALGTTADGAGGTISNPARAPYIFLGCSIDQSGPLSTRSLPPGLSLNFDTCLITGTPTSSFSDTTFGNMGGKVTYNIDLYYKGPNYLGPGTEEKVTSQMQLRTNAKPVIDPAQWNAPTYFKYFLLGGSTTAITDLYYELGALTKYGPKLDGTLSNGTYFSTLYIDCTLDATSDPLPSGIYLDPTTCGLGGGVTGSIPATQPTNLKINMRYKDPTYTGPGTEKTIQAAVQLYLYHKPANLAYTQHDRVLMKLDGTGSLATNTDVTSAGVSYDPSGLLISSSSKSTVGIVKYLDTANSLVGAVKVIPLTLASSSGFSIDGFVYAAGGAIGKIQNINGNTVYIERTTSDYNFSAAEAVKYDSNGATTYAAASGSASTVSSIDTAYIFDSAIQSLDNNSQFYSTKYNFSTITQVFEKGKSINGILAPIANTQIASNNGLTYSVAPALPAGLTLNASTGQITGSFTNTLASTKFTITATNALGSTSTDLYLSAIEAPTALSYTTRELITVGSNANFNEGESIYQRATPPLLAVEGKVIRKYDTTLLSISTVNGPFEKSGSIDSGNLYLSEKTTVSSTIDPIFYNTTLVVSSVATVSAGQFVTSSSGAEGRVMYVHSGSKTLFIQYMNSSSTPILFSQGDTFSVSASSGAGYSASALTIDQVEADNMQLTLSAVPGSLLPGDEITAALAATPAVGELSGYIHKVSGSIVYVSDINRREAQSQYFRTTQLFYIGETMAGNQGSLSAVTNDNFYIVENKVTSEIKANVAKGNGITYSISPALPTGLSLNTITGTISGKADFASPRTKYTVTAKNIVNESKFVFELEVRDFFKVADNSGTPSFIMHKYGDARGARKCRINSADIKNFYANNSSVNSTTLDIRCFLDAEEEDLHFNPIKLAASAGAGVCEYIQVYPFSFWVKAAATTIANYDYQTGCTATPTAAPSAETLCAANYTAFGGPNCDDGEITVTTHTWTMNNATPATCSNEALSISTIKCGGKKSNCLIGPVRDILTDAQIVSGARSLIHQSSSGNVVQTAFSSPADHLDYTNLRAANGVVTNQCTSTNTDADNWVSYQAGLASTDNPFASGSNPYYVVNCLDAAKDIKARFRIIVRDWDKTFKLKDSIDYDLPGGAMTNTTMNNNTVVFGKSNNDYYDWDDSYNGAAATNAGTCAVPNFTSKYKFPGSNL